MNYSFPIDLDWSTEEMVKVVEYLDIVEKSYHQAVSTKELIDKYKAFKTVVSSKGEEKQIGRKFEKDTGYSLYQTIETAKRTEKMYLKMNNGK
ncbi:uncharacterized protein YktA (UPF0223 family) [Streptohalobacillus salinus]|uniref:Uncharacterized protein YktA (UPF0223 family) n=1 Tax=Streptohalobacillus salinus TaxID=621096 RepID=A0A2V3WUI5_9BACI|nr:UPF0223 family protein [Streptohalobacillus salinus]PXW92632.1 uncharacterized protein YktA (UPF0223 family) [Streptohalobacillus salinus]